MTKEEIKARMAEIVEEENEIYDELEAIENEPEESDEPADWTPQSQIDYLNDMLAELKEEYYDLWKELGPDAA